MFKFIEISVLWSGLKKAAPITMGGIILLFTYILGEEYLRHGNNIVDMWGNGWWLMQEKWYYKLRNEDINRILEAIAFISMMKCPNKRNYGYVWVYLIYRCLDLLLFFYNGKVELEYVVYILAGIADFIFLMRNMIYIHREGIFRLKRDG